MVRGSLAKSRLVLLRAGRLPAALGEDRSVDADPRIAARVRGANRVDARGERGHGRAGIGTARQAGLVAAWRGLARHGMAGEAWRGEETRLRRKRERGAK